jgi:hypothetical protein
LIHRDTNHVAIATGRGLAAFFTLILIISLLKFLLLPVAHLIQSFALPLPALDLIQDHLSEFSFSFR